MKILLLLVALGSCLSLSQACFSSNSRPRTTTTTTVRTTTRPSRRTVYGDIAHLTPTGQSGDVYRSENDVRQDLSDLSAKRSCYDSAADRYGIQAAVIAAIASRESRGGRLLRRTGGYGDNGNAWGIMQCDLRTSGLPCRNCAWDSCCHIDMMVSRLLIPNIQRVQRKHPSWSLAQQLQGGVAAYNFGVSNVRTWSGLDIGTTNDDYSNDVMARAKYLQRIGWD